MIAGSTANLLDAAEGRELLRIARESLRRFLEGASTEAPLTLSADALSGKLGEPRGVFVTLTNEGRLRGCTGYVEGVRPVAEAVADLAISSASRDSRFPPVRRTELTNLHIEISVLTPLHPIDPAEVEIGRHGLLARLRGRSGLLLPQVPVDWGWERQQFLEHTCEKAGLHPDAWKSPEFQLLAFEAQIFSEGEDPPAEGGEDR